MILVQFLVSMFATVGFAILFNASKTDWFFCGLSGAIGWIVYLMSMDAGMPLVISCMLATLVLTIFSRSLAVIRKTPATIYLLTGIFPLVPGAGIYYTAYYLIHNEMSLCASKGAETCQTAGGIVFGIIFGFIIPQGWFLKIFHSRKDSGGKKQQLKR